jgi:5-methylthioadenosine/S-adenosylhomocysteine deaminase
MMPVIDPYASVVQSAMPAMVDTVIADGKVLKRGGQLTSPDLPVLAQDVERAIKDLM